MVLVEVLFQAHTKQAEMKYQISFSMKGHQKCPIHTRVTGQKGGVSPLEKIRMPRVR